MAAVGRTVPGQTRPDPTLDEVQALADKRSVGGFPVADAASQAEHDLQPFAPGS